MSHECTRDAALESRTPQHRRYWRAANYLSVGQIYLYDNPLLKTPLTLAHIKPRLLGHWRTWNSKADHDDEQTREKDEQAFANHVKAVPF